MSIERIHQDYKYLAYTMDSPDISNYFDIRESTHKDAAPALYSSTWKTLKLKFVDMNENGATQMPDLSLEMGLLFLNQRAYKVLNTLLADHGEFLPIRYNDIDGYLFNVLKVAEDLDALLEELVGYDEHGNLEHFAFDESKINKTHLFVAEIDDYIGLFCTSEFIDTVTDAKLTGINFYPDVSNVIGSAYPIMQ